VSSTPFTGTAALAALLALPLVLAGCDDASPSAKAAALGKSAVSDQAQQAREAAEAKLRTDLRGVLSFREVRAFPQSAAETVAVCGQVAVGGGQFAPFVSLVTRQAEGGPAVEQHLATDGVSATRVYVEARTRCTDKATTMASAHRLTAPPPLPTIPADLRMLATPAPASVGRIEAAARQAEAEPGIAMRQNGNLRAQPSGGGEVLRVVPRGAALRVFAQAPGGWLQVGQDAPEGWMHSSMVTRLSPQPGPTLAAAER
jgi:hypothetical protein